MKTENKQKINWVCSLTCRISGYSFLLISVLNVRTSKMILYVQVKRRTTKKITIVILHQVCSLDFSEVNNRSVYLKFLFTLREHDFFRGFNERKWKRQARWRKLICFSIFASHFSLQSKNQSKFLH